MRRIAAAVLMAASALPAYAQTAEETGAYILFSIENGAAFEGSPPEVTIVQDGASPAKYDVVNPKMPKSQKMTFSVIKIDDCKFQSEMAVRDGDKTLSFFGSLTNFANVTEIRKSPAGSQGNIILLGSDQCTFKLNISDPSIGNVKDSCAKQAPLMFANDKNLDRVNKALGHLKASFCKGRAF